MAEDLIGKEKTGTIFQGLNRFFKNKDSYTEDRGAAGFLDTELARTKSREEFDRLLLQKQQMKHMRAQWGKMNSVVSQKMLNYESYRLVSYYDYEMMGSSDIIGRVLELYAEECCVLNEKGFILNIQSDNKRVQRELHNLFYNKLNIHQNLYMWVYSMVKLGDVFLHLNLDDTKGIVGTRQLPALEMERIEGDYMAKYYSGRVNNNEDTQFRWRGDNTVDFKKWQVAHGRVLLDETAFPYGTSMLKKVRKLYQDIALAIDSSLSEHLIRSVDRLIFKVDVGGLGGSEEEIEQYLANVMARIKKKKVVDPRTGQIDHKQNFLSVDSDYVIPIRGANDGSSITKLEGTTDVKTSLIEFLQNRFLSALGVPKAFLNFTDAAGDGKNLANLDIRFARTVIRIQQSVIAFLNEIAIIHLFLRGFEDELGNFSLSLNNPSTQAEALRLELLQAKLGAFRDATDVSNGIAAMSFAKAKKEIFGMTDDEIMNDLKQQRIDRAVAAELANTPMIITNSGIFDKVDAIYANPSVDKNAIGLGGGDDENAPAGGGGGGGGMGGLDMGGGGEDMGDELDTDTDVGGDSGGDSGGSEQNDGSGVDDAGAEDDGKDIELGEGFNLEEYVEKLLRD